MPNVRRRIEREGGEEVLGWKIWEWYGVMIEAEFHMVWRSPGGVLRDITPNQLPFEQILFLPDPSLTYLGRQVNNIRCPLNADPRVVDFIRDANEFFLIQNEGDRAALSDISETISNEERARLKFLLARRALLEAEISNSTPRRNELCRCGSGRKYKKCCGRVAS